MPEEIKKEIGELIDILKKHNIDIKWVTTENLHITLKFLGNTPENLLSEIKESLSNVVSFYKPFYIKINTTGVFPNKKYPRVIWVGINDSEILNKLKMDIEKSMALLGFPKEDKEFNPHITIGRVRSQKGILNLINELDNFKEKNFGGTNIKSIKLMKSELKPKGAEYSCIYEILFSQK